MNFFNSQFFKDGTGELSQMRLIMFWVVAVILGIFVLGNIAAMIHAVQAKEAFRFVDFAPQMIYALGLVIMGKVGQAALAEKGVK